MTQYCDDKTEVAQYVKDILPPSFLEEWPWIIAISQAPFGGYYVHTAIGTEWEDTVENTYKYLKTLLNISTEITPMV